jgi:adenosylcobinamide-GDP ribazoletransferase
MMINRFILAWQLLTVIPIKQISWNDEDLRGSMLFFPIVGLLLGGIIYIANRILLPLFHGPLTDLMLLLLLTILTGGLHLDGFADTVDGLAGGKDREETLAIMKDGRVGAFAVIGLMFIIGAKFLALDALPDGIKGKVLLLFPVIGRWSMVLGAAVSKSARLEGGLGKPYLGNLGPMTISGASAACFVIAVTLFRWNGLLVPAAVGTVIFLMVAYIHRRIGGITGDVLGALNEIGEAFMLVLMVGVLR